MIKSFSHVVVDGSNLATEGRTEPSLKQLNDAVLAFIKEFPGTKVTVVVDATFGHRIDRRERAEFDEAINNNELVAPPAGAVGRGDGFVLTIAEKVKASVLSNDSYQEFHDQYKWLFDEGRLIGGKPVPNVGWVFIQRLPVRKQAGRETAATLRRAKSVRAPMKPMPVPKSPPPSSRPTSGATKSQNQSSKPTVVEKVVHKPTHKAAHKQAHKQSHTPQQKVLNKPAQKPLPKLNDVTPFLNFVEKNPIGAKLRGVVDSYASHGVYVKVGEISGYLAMRLMANPIPRSAREHVKLGTTLSLVVVGYTPSRRSVELAVAGMESLVLVKQTAKSSVQSSAQSAARGTKASAPRTQQTKKAKRRARHGKPVAKKSAPNKKR